MKKSGKMPVWAIVLIILVGVIFFILVAIIILEMLGYNYFSGPVFTHSYPVLDPPFYMSSSMASNSGITLELTNNGGDNCIIKSVEVSDCGKTSTSTPISSGETKMFSIPCSLAKGETFNGKLVIAYSKENSSVEFNSTGLITETVA